MNLLSLREITMENYNCMSVEYTELDSGVPAVVFCSEFTVPITAKTFVKTFITNYEDRELWFKLPHVSGNQLSFSWANESQGVLEVNWKKMPMGYSYAGDLYNAFCKCSQTLQELSRNTETE